MEKLLHVDQTCRDQTIRRTDAIHINRRQTKTWSSYKYATQVATEIILQVLYDLGFKLTGNT